MENNIFEASKGKWEIPIKKFKKLSRNTCKYNLGYLSNCCLYNDSLLCCRFDINLLVINADSAYEVKAFHAGEVILVAEIDSLKYAVSIKFGDYYVSYYPLQNLTINKGNTISAGLMIDSLAKDLDDNFNLAIRVSFK